MADAKITELTANSTPISTDLSVMVDDPGGVPLTQKIVLSDLMALFANPVSDDGNSLGVPGSEWSDLYLAEGGMVSWANEDVSLAQVGNKVTLAGADLISPNYVLATGGGLRTAKLAANTALLQAYDVDGGAYTTFATLTANNTPTFDLADTVTKASNYIYRGGGTDVLLADGGTGASLADPNDDRMFMWDDSAGATVLFDNDATITIGAATWGVTAASDTQAGAIELAIQSEMETGTDVVRAVVPGRQHYHPSAAKCWVECGVAADVTVAYNVPSTADGGAGITTVTIGNDFSSANWACVVGAQGGGTTVTLAKACSVYTQAAGTVILSTYDFSATPVLEDPVHFYMAGFGDTNV
jgi:hypothetical protein